LDKKKLCCGFFEQKNVLFKQILNHLRNSINNVFCYSAALGFGCCLLFPFPIGDCDGIVRIHIPASPTKDYYSFSCLYTQSLFIKVYNQKQVPNMETNYDEEKRKYECMNPQQWAASAKRLINERDTIEKKILHKDMELIREWNNLDKGRQENMAATSKKIKWFKFHLDKILVRLHDQLNNGGVLGEYYDQNAAKENLQEMLESFESKLSAFKEKMRMEFDELDREERQLTTDIVGLHNKIENPVSDTQPDDVGHVHISHGEHQAELLKKTQQQIRQQQQQRMQEDVEHKAAIGEIDRELASLGKHGGWDVRDHDVFLRTWNIFFGNNELVKRFEDAETKEVTFVFSITAVQEKQLFRKLEHDVFAKSADELKEHVSWYGKTLELLAKKKRLLSDWKIAQNNRKRSMNNEILMEEQLATAVEIETLNTVKQEDQDDKAKGEEEEKRMQAKSRIAKWKQDRLKQQQEEEMQKRQLAAKKQKEAADEVSV
jgi:hypothetical protein